MDSFLMMNLFLCAILIILSVCSGNPSSKPYVPFRTNPFDQTGIVHHDLSIPNDHRSRSTPRRPDTSSSGVDQCPLQFTLGLSRRAHHAPDAKSMAIVEPPSIFPVHPSYGPGRQVVHLTQYEHLDVLTPSEVTTEPKVVGSSSSKGGGSGGNSKEGIMQHQDFPLLFESSSFLGSPIIHDVNGDGISDAILADYDGGIYFVGLQVGKDHRRYFHTAQVPRLFIRREWMIQRLNETLQTRAAQEAAGTAQVIKQGGGGDDAVNYNANDPYHSYFEYGNHATDGEVLRGVTADVMGQAHSDVKGLETRRQRRNDKIKQHKDAPFEPEEERGEGDEDVFDLAEHNKTAHHRHRRLQQVDEHERHDGDHHDGDRDVHQDAHHDGDHDGDSHGVHHDGDHDGDSHGVHHDGDHDGDSHGVQHDGDHDGDSHGVQHDGDHDGDSHGVHHDGDHNPHQDGHHDGHHEEDHHDGDHGRDHHDVHHDGDGDHDPHHNGDHGGDHHDGHHDSGHGRVQQDSHQNGRHDADVGEYAATIDADHDVDPRDAHDVAGKGPDDDALRNYDQNGEGQAWPDDDVKEDVTHTDDELSGGDTERDIYAGYDDYYGSRHHQAQNDYYDEKHYIRLPPHILSTPVLADMKKAYGDSNEREEMLFIAVSYYFDEDEYEGQFSYKRFENSDKGDETETDRGKHVASALVAYIIDGSSPRFGREEHLDLSGDFTAPHDATMVIEIPLHQNKYNNMVALALSPPTVADIDGNGDEDVIIGTSMGIVYCLHARHMYNSDGWPIQLPHPVESRILVEDVLGNTNLEIFIVDAAANVYCLDAKGVILWRRDLLTTISPQSDLRGLSPMTMGDVDGDGILDIVLSMKVMSSHGDWITFVIAISAVTGDDVKNFPLEFDSPLLIDDGSGNADLLEKLPQPLLIDLHADQDHWKAYIYRNGTAWNPPTKRTDKKKSSGPPHGGSAAGLHIVQPVGTSLNIIEAGSGCTQVIAVGEEITSMVQADDVHGTNNIDLVISTKAGNIVTLESPAVPYHPLNVWNSGEVRGRRNNFAQGFSASQGIFVHEMSRQYRDIFGVYVPITFEIFDNRPNIENEPEKRVYNVEIRDGTSAKRAMLRKTYNQVGVYTERLYISFGPGYYTITVLLRTTHGLMYEDSFHVGYNVHYMDGFGLLLFLPLMLAATFIILFSRQKAAWDDEAYDEVARGKNQGILGASN